MTARMDILTRWLEESSADRDCHSTGTVIPSEARDLLRESRNIATVGDARARSLVAALLGMTLKDCAATCSAAALGARGLLSFPPRPRPKAPPPAPPPGTPRPLPGSNR